MRTDPKLLGGFDTFKMAKKILLRGGTTAQVGNKLETLNVRK